MYDRHDERLKKVLGTLEEVAEVQYQKANQELQKNSRLLGELESVHQGCQWQPGVHEPHLLKIFAEFRDKVGSSVTLQQHHCQQAQEKQQACEKTLQFHRTRQKAYEKLSAKKASQQQLADEKLEQDKATEQHNNSRKSQDYIDR